MNKIMSKDPKILVLLLHGLGSSSENFFYFAYEMSKKLPFANFEIPNAFEQFPFDRFGYQWFDVGNREPAWINQKIKTASSKLSNFIDKKLQEHNMTDKQLIVGGFSQGGMMSLYTCLRRQNPCLGICSFSGSLINPESLPSEIKSKPETCIIHGTEDEVVPFSNHKMTCDALSRNNVPFVEYKRKGLGHYITSNEINIAAEFITDRTLTL